MNWFIICLSREKILMYDFFYLMGRKLLLWLFLVLIFFFFFRETLRYPSVVAPVVMETNHYRLIFLPYGQLNQTKWCDVFLWFIFLWLDHVKPVDSLSFLLFFLSEYRIERNCIFSNAFYSFTHNIHSYAYVHYIHLPMHTWIFVQCFDSED